MESSEILTFFGSNLYVFLLFIPFVSQLGLPIGAMFFILFAGSLVNSFAELFILFCVVLFSTVVGDFVSYFIGRKLSHLSYFKYLLHKKNIKYIYKKSEKFFHKNGNISIFISRFLITGIGPALNYVVGFQSFNFKKFSIYIILGEILYSAELLILGYIFKETFEDIFNIFSNFGFALLLIFVLYKTIKKLLKK